MLRVALMMMLFNCSYRKKNEPSAIYPSFGYSYLPAAHAVHKSWPAPGVYPASHSQLAKVDAGASVPLSTGQAKQVEPPSSALNVLRGHGAHASSLSEFAM